GSHRDRRLRRRKSSCLLRGEASLGRHPCSTCRCRKSVVTRKKDCCRRTCVILLVPVTFPCSSAHVQGLPRLSSGQRFRLWASAASSAAPFLIEAVLPLAQYAPCPLADINAANGGEA